MLWGALAGSALAMPFLAESLEMLAWVASVPLLLLLACGRSGRGVTIALSAGLAFVATGLWWLCRLSPAAVGIATLLFGAYFVAFAIIPWVRHRIPALPLWSYVPLLWAFGESLPARVTPYPTTWLNIGYTQAQVLPLAQLAEWTGVSGVTLLVLLANSALADALLAWGRGRGWAAGEAWPSRRALLWGLGLAIGLPTVAGAWGALRLVQVRATLRAGPRLLLVQGNITPADATPGNAARVLAKLVRLSGAARDTAADLVVWPETAPIRPEHPDDLEAARSIGATLSRPLLLGGTGMPRVEGERRHSNSAFLLSPDGKPLVRYDKQVLVPFGETVPFVDGIPALRRRVEEYVWNRYGFLPLLQAGTESTLFPLEHAGRTLKFGVLICYEDVLPSLVENFARRGADFFVVISNENFFYPREMDQHLDMAVFRAIETRRPVVRATNTGLTAAIDPTGAITARLERDTEGTLDVVVPLSSGLPLRRTVRLFGLSCGVALALLLAAALVRRPPASGATIQPNAPARRREQPRSKPRRRAR